MIDRMAHPSRRGNKRLALHTCGMVVVVAVVAAAVEVEVELQRQSYQTQTLSRDLWYVLPRVVGAVGRVSGVGYVRCRRQWFAGPEAVVLAHLLLCLIIRRWDSAKRRYSGP